MKDLRIKPREQGLVTIAIAVIMLLLITLMVTTAFSLSTTNLRAVGNVQARQEAIAAAHQVIEQVVLEDATLATYTSSKPSTTDVDINNDGTDDYSVVIQVPVCVRATRANTVTSSSVTLPGFSAGDAWNTVWEITAVATEASTGASVTVVHGIRYLMTEVEKDDVCA